jgi:hypothetical protein
MTIRPAPPHAISLSAVLIPLLATACSSSGGGGTPQPVMCFGANVIADEANNYSFSSTITLPPVSVKSRSNLTFDWRAVTMDFLKHPLNAVNDINTISVLLWHLPLAQLQTNLNADNLSQSDLEIIPPPSWPAPGATTGGLTQAHLYDFTVNGTVIQPGDFDTYFDPTMFPPAQYSFLAVAATGTTIGQGFRMLQSFNLDPTTASTTIALNNTSTQLTYQVNLHALTITGVPGGTAALTLDSAQMTTNALGAPFPQGYITSAVVGHYTETPAQLESKFLDLDRIATNYYRADIPSGTVLDFRTLRDSAGNNFPGVDASGTWVVGLICGNCRNPAPWYLTILKPCTPP